MPRECVRGPAAHVRMAGLPVLAGCMGLQIYHGCESAAYSVPPAFRLTAVKIDGNGWSARFKRLMTSNSLIFKSTIFPEW